MDDEEKEMCRHVIQLLKGIHARVQVRVNHDESADQLWFARAALTDVIMTLEYEVRR